MSMCLSGGVTARNVEDACTAASDFPSVLPETAAVWKGD